MASHRNAPPTVRPHRGARAPRPSHVSWITTEPIPRPDCTTVTSSSGAVHRYIVNDGHQVVAEIDPLGAISRFERDRYNRLLSRTDPLGHTNRFAYDESGQLTS
ncbi:hypothetical protein, partial [Streptomyces sp. NPDC002785]|uniref:hypothetical protein n=1 Tax=Streptomyces sp. NPDC002785 TaxID=3154543 RepID=UPI00332284D2